MLLTTAALGIICLIYAFTVDIMSDITKPTPTRAAVVLGVGLALVLAGIGAAHAADFEASVGKSAGATDQAFSLGLTGLISDNLRWRAGFADTGNPGYSKFDSPDEALDDIQAGEGSGPYYRTRAGNGDKELYATLAPEIHRGDWVFSVEAGAAIYRPNDVVDLQIWSASGGNTRPAITPIIGASVGYRKTSIVFSMQRKEVVGDDDGTYPTLIKTISLRRIF